MSIALNIEAILNRIEDYLTNSNSPETPIGIQNSLDEELNSVWKDKPPHYCSLLKTLLDMEFPTLIYKTEHSPLPTEGAPQKATVRDVFILKDQKPPFVSGRLQQIRHMLYQLIKKCEELMKEDPPLGNKPWLKQSDW
jgi:hypothetical protein